MPPTRNKPAFYAVAKGRKPGIYTEWEACKEQILNYNGAKYKKFANPTEAEVWIRSSVGDEVAREALQGFLSANPAFGNTFSSPPQAAPEAPQPIPSPAAAPAAPVHVPSAQVTAHAAPTGPSSASRSFPYESLEQPADGRPWVVYSDGACRGNGKVGAVAGIGVWWGQGHQWNLCERCPGDQTNNRAELIAIIRVLETAPMDKRPLIIKSDSAYSIGCLTEWLPAWKMRNWIKSDGKPVQNVPLVKYADILLKERRDYAQQPVEFVKVLGHSGEEGNEGADKLANLGATMPLVPDRDWEDLIRQTRARMSDFPQAVNDTAPAGTVETGIVHRTLPPPVPPPAPARVSPPIAPTPAPEQAYQQDSTIHAPSVDNESKPGVVAPQPPSQGDTLYGDPNLSISPEELEMYADCLLSDDEFLREAETLVVRQ